MLRPLKPLPFTDKQYLVVTVTDEVTRSVLYNARELEFEWLRVNGPQYAGKWVAVEGAQLISDGQSAKSVMDQAQGLRHPLVALSRRGRAFRLEVGEALVFALSFFLAIARVVNQCAISQSQENKDA